MPSGRSPARSRSTLAIWVVSIGVGCHSPAGAVRVAESSQCRGTPPVIVLTRHAEKASDDADPALSDKGNARAARLARLLARSAPTRLFATDTKRTQGTLAPLATAVHVAVEVRPARDIAGLSRELLELPSGAVVIVAHHSNGVPKLAHALGVELPKLDAGNLAHDAFGRVFLVVPSCGERKATVVELDSDEETAPR